MKFEISEESAKTLYRYLGKLTPNETYDIAEEYKISVEKLIKATDELYEALDDLVGKTQRITLK